MRGQHYINNSSFVSFFAGIWFRSLNMLSNHRFFKKYNIMCRKNNKKKYSINKFRAKILEYSKFTHYKNNVFCSPNKSRKVCESQGTESGFKIMSEINAVNVSYMRIWRKWVPFYEIKKIILLIFPA